MKKQDNLIKIILSALLLALALVLPFLTAHDMRLGNVFCPMHIPVLLCGFICGMQYGCAVGFIAPLMRFLILSAPPIHKAVPMAFELAVYGLIAGLMYKILPKKKQYIYLSLLVAMVAGRIALGVAKLVYFGFGGEKLILNAFVTEAFITAIPGIVIQIVLIPVIVMLFENINKNKGRL